MVVVAVAEHDGIDAGQINAERLRVVREGAGGAGVHQQPVVMGLEIETQAMFAGAAGITGVFSIKVTIRMDGTSLPGRDSSPRPVCLTVL